MKSQRFLWWDVSYTSLWRGPIADKICLKKNCCALNIQIINGANWQLSYITFIPAQDLPSYENYANLFKFTTNLNLTGECFILCCRTFIVLIETTNSCSICPNTPWLQMYPGLVATDATGTTGRRPIIFVLNVYVNLTRNPNLASYIWYHINAT